MTAPKFHELDLLREAVAEVRDLGSIAERHTGDDIRNAKVGDNLGTGKDGSADTIQDRVMTKYKATKATVMNIQKGMQPKDAIKRGIAATASPAAHQNPDVKSVLSDLALNYPNIFNKHFRKGGKLMQNSFEAEIEDDLVAEDVAIDAIGMLQAYFEEQLGFEMSPEDIAELVNEAVSIMQEGLGKKS